MQQFLDMKVSDFLLGGEWVIPSELLEMIQIKDLPVTEGGADRKIWTGNISGNFSVASAVESIREKIPKPH